MKKPVRIFILSFHSSFSSLDCCFSPANPTVDTVQKKLAELFFPWQVLFNEMAYHNSFRNAWARPNSVIFLALVSSNRRKWRKSSHALCLWWTRFRRPQSKCCVSVKFTVFKFSVPGGIEDLILIFNLYRVYSGLGFNIRGGSDANYLRGHPGIFVTSIKPGGSADRDSRLKIGDRLLEVN